MGVWKGHVHTAIFKMDNKNLLYITWNSIQCYVPAWMDPLPSGGERIWLSEKK